MFINHFFVENIDNQRIKYYKEGNQYGLHANGHQMIFHHPIVEDIEKDNPKENDHHIIEALVKAVAHALKEAVKPNGGQILSSKGMLA